MAQATNIEWCDSTFNGWIGCTKVSPGCDHCYAAVSTPARTLPVTWGANAPRHRTSASNWKMPLQWQAGAEAFHTEHGRNRRVFCSSLADVFDNAVPSQWRADLFALIEATPDLDWLLLTKRIGNVVGMMRDVAHSLFWMDRLESCALPANAWLGATVIDQAEADRDVPKLLRTPAKVRFLSIEPMLGPIAFDGMFANDSINDGTNALEALDWVICGGESGSRARPMHPDWARSLRDQCGAAGVPFLFKQWGTWAEFDDGLPGVRTVIEGDPAYRSEAAKCDAFMAIDGSVIQSLDDAAPDVRYRGLTRAGKHAAGRLLDGRTHDEFPQR